MVLASPTPIPAENIRALDLPVIDMSFKSSHVSKLLVKACEEFGCFKVVNHGVAQVLIDKMAEEGLSFFAKTDMEKRRAGLPKPLGYGNKNIGFHGDVGDVEYLLLRTNPHFISQASKSISKDDPTKFNLAVNDYTQAVKNLACEILEVMTEGLRVHDKYAFSRFIKDVDSDSLIRFNHYPPSKSGPSSNSPVSQSRRIGFGEHSDPQIITILHSNAVDGLQVALNDGTWVPVPPDPMGFFVIVGDLLQVMSNGRFRSARHRVLANTNGSGSRISVVYFGAPPVDAVVHPLPEMVKHAQPCLYRPFTWGEFKQTTYSLQLAHNRLDFFTLPY